MLNVSNLIKAVIFDMDGVIIDSEPLWELAEKTAFKAVGIHLTQDLCLQTQGLRVDEVVDYWFERHPWPLAETSKIEVADTIIENLQTLIADKAQPMKGVLSTIEWLSHNNIPLAIASSSPMNIINTVVDCFDIRHYFQVLKSAQFEDYGKPHPSVYISTAKELGVSPTQCLAIEDSFNGLLAAKSARMFTLVVPEESMAAQTRFDIADLKLQDLTQVNRSQIMEMFNYKA